MYDQDMLSNGGMFDDASQGTGGTPNPYPPATQGTSDWVSDGQGSWMPPPSSWPAGKVWDPKVAGFVDAPAQQTTPLPSGGGGPAPAPAPGGLIQPFTEPYTQATPAPLPTIGGSVATIPGAPQFPSIPKFAGPTMEEAMAEPGYQFVLDQGNKNLTNWAGAQGTLNDSNTAKAFIDYGQGAAGQQYANVWNRARDAYQMNTATQYLDPFQAAYQNWTTGTVGPTMTNFSTNAQNTMHQNDVNWQDDWNKWLQDWNIFRDQRDSTFDKQFATARS